MVTTGCYTGKCQYGCLQIRTVHQSCAEWPPWASGRQVCRTSTPAVYVMVAESTSRRGCLVSREILSVPCKQQKTVQETSGAGHGHASRVASWRSPSGVLAALDGRGGGGGVAAGDPVDAIAALTAVSSVWHQSILFILAAGGGGGGSGGGAAEDSAGASAGQQPLPGAAEAQPQA